MNNGAEIRPIHINQIGVSGIKRPTWSISIRNNATNFKVVVVITVFPTLCDYLKVFLYHSIPRLLYEDIHLLASYLKVTNFEM